MYIERVRINGIRGFHGDRAADLTFPRPTDPLEGKGSWTVLAGRNGSGKTTLLRAIALGLVGPAYARNLVADFGSWISPGADTGEIHTSIVRVPNWGTFTHGASVEAFDGNLAWNRLDSGRGVRVTGPVDVTTADGPTASSRGPWAEDSNGWYVMGYGPFRRLESSASHAQRLAQAGGPVGRLASLFSEDVSLTESVEWLKDVHLRRLEGRLGAGGLMDFVIRILNDGLLPDGFQVERVDADGLWARHAGVVIALHELSDGYRTVAALVLDLIRHIHTAEGDHVLDFYDDSTPTPVIYTPGVVLIDEIDVHLHVSWQKTIGGWLKRHFPGMQFIVSSHSPYICQSADPGGLIRLPGANEDSAPHVVSDDLYERVVYGSGDDALLTDLFGIDSPYSEAAEAKRQRLAALEVAIMRGTASVEERQEYVALNRTLNSSLAARVDEVASRLGPRE
ncbi:AAA family ATPase [Nocardiopsis tropica]|uniref:AAA family ATPase n=1 Tax=Nocardiopsis tropica TaxID=109330 RepID=A0ABU7KJH2_9ACTN|nr:AAA family ATPase [Nocardiopsis umidischolae]MEE2049427.1 AAA family ATPase [Nocardiopsis umidischolae]